MSSLAAILAATTAPFLFIQPTSANTPSYLIGQRPLNSAIFIPAGTTIPIRYEQERIIVTPDERLDVTLVVDTNIRDDRGALLIPEGSQIEGELVPVDNGVQFVAERLAIAHRNRDRRPELIPIRASSAVISRRETITRRSNPELLEGAAIGGSAAAVLAEVTGDIDLWEVLGGAGLGAIASVLLRGNEQVEAIVIEPEADLTLTLERDVQLTQRFNR